jgi:hypothetical protein
MITVSSLCVVAGAILFVTSVLEWQGQLAAWAAGGFSAMLIGLCLLVTISVDALLHALKRLDAAEPRR